MAECQLLAGCIFFNDKMQDKPGTAELMKTRYCRDNFAGCARYMIFEKLGRPKVPPDLFPNQTDKAAKLILASQ
jgi:hypothetical protein